jgi:hypothetical protein
MWLHELGERPFTRAERNFLSRAGRANVPLDVLMERVEALVGPEQPVRGRPAFLTKCLLDQRLFSEPEEARAFAESYYELAKAGPISKHLLWDWE